MDRKKLTKDNWGGGPSWLQCAAGKIGDDTTSGWDYYI